MHETTYAATIELRFPKRNIIEIGKKSCIKAVYLIDEFRTAFNNVCILQTITIKRTKEALNFKDIVIEIHTFVIYYIAAY